MRNGDYLRITKLQFNGESAKGCFPPEYLPAWARITNVGATGSHAALLLTSYPRITGIPGYKPPNIYVADHCDEFTVVPEEELPDEALVAIARHALVGDDHAD